VRITPAQVRVLCRSLRSDSKRVPTTEQDGILCTAAQTGIERDLALETMLWCHHGLILKMAARLARHGNHDDAVVAGKLGLTKAVLCFQPERGHKFSTYATHWIGSTMRRVTVQANFSAHIPEHSLYRWLRIRRYGVQYADAHGRWPDNTQIATALGVDVAEVEDSIGIARMEQFSFDSLEHRGIDSDSTSLAPTSPSPEQEIILSAELDRLHEALAQLTDAQRYAIEQYFGLDGDPKTYREIGEQIGVTGQAIDQRVRLGCRILQRLLK